jgi:cyclic pyranopterin phosphate synthase
VLAGLEAAAREGFTGTKTNTVVVGPSADDDLRNDDEVAAITRWAWSIGATPRFLELMTIGEGAKLARRVVPYREMCALLSELVEIDANPNRLEDRGPAGYLRARDGSGRAVGFITGASDTFCAGCDRLRATSNGALRPCLATNDSIDVRGAVRSGDLEGIGRGLDEAWAMKPDGSEWNGCNEASAAGVNMRATGG